MQDGTVGEAVVGLDGVGGRLSERLEGSAQRHGPRRPAVRAFPFDRLLRHSDHQTGPEDLEQPLISSVCRPRGATVTESGEMDRIFWFKKKTSQMRMG